MRRVLLDECLPHKLRLHLTAHDVVTVSYAGLDGLSNGDLLQAAEEAGFEVFVTADRALPHQQNMGRRSIAIVALTGQIWDVIRVHLPAISEAIETARGGTVTSVHCGTYTRRWQHPYGPASQGSQ